MTDPGCTMVMFCREVLPGAVPRRRGLTPVSNCLSETPNVTYLAVLFSLMLVSGCAHPTYYETAPVEVETPRGVVTCQLYTPEEVLLDEAIFAPDGMSIPEADAFCRAEGHRRKSEA